MKPSITVIHWSPRIICILAILFISLFAGDALEHGDTLWEKLAALLGHLIPSFVLLALLLIAWKWEFVGGIIFMTIGFGFIPYIVMRSPQSAGWTLVAVLAINMPFILVGLLFLASHRMKKNSK